MKKRTLNLTEPQIREIALLLHNDAVAEANAEEEPWRVKLLNNEILSQEMLDSLETEHTEVSGSLWLYPNSDGSYSTVFLVNVRHADPAYIANDWIPISEYKFQVPVIPVSKARQMHLDNLAQKRKIVSAEARRKLDFIEEQKHRLLALTAPDTPDAQTIVESFNDDEIF